MEVGAFSEASIMFVTVKSQRQSGSRSDVQRSGLDSKNYWANSLVGMIREGEIKIL